MQELLDKLIRFGIENLYGEGERFLKIQALTALLGVVRGARRVFLLQHILVTACFTWALSLFGTGYVLASQYTLTASVALTPVLAFTTGTLLIMTILLGLLAREKTWVNVSGIQKHLQELQNPTRPFQSSPAAAPMTRQEIAELVNQVLEQKLAQKPPENARESVANEAASS